jgi:hypothetical protein
MTQQDQIETLMEAGYEAVHSFDTQDVTLKDNCQRKKFLLLPW